MSTVQAIEERLKENRKKSQGESAKSLLGSPKNSRILQETVISDFQIEKSSQIKENAFLQEKDLDAAEIIPINSLQNTDFRRFIANLSSRVHDKYEEGLAQRIFNSKEQPKPLQS